MINNKAQQQYLRSKVLTASPGELVLILYDGCIKFCNIAIEGIEEKNIEKANNNIKKAEKIINELRSTLNYNYSISQDFNIVYNYITKKLHEGNINKNSQPIKESIIELRDLREIWKQVMEKTKKKGK